ncbi:winged helix-turn-helix domain-containing protein [Anaerosacchariphilus polymeriproducens]|uniref:Stage 0 sporulation protein A homolog n=1 Tax=Anaerosacchariphilus polymeriproducens TaxID=1812858 RepID=A0A371AWH2_9FIRM|nr:response regulator transcription factor [Anaerosacchariphilus polymeriproducens]RDU23882.1 DNA-binding response regulator [Anaerosacchariphilus polymeriproducens]
MIYCVEDEFNIRELFLYTLESTGFQAKGFSCGSELFQALETQIPQLILLDIMLQGEDGIEILKKIKSSTKTKDIPVIMVTAKGAEYDKVIGLDTGADDYMTKPVGMMELISRIKAVLRRTSNKQKNKDYDYQIKDLTMNVDKHIVTVAGEDVTLSCKEFNLLKLLMEHKGSILNRDQLLEQIWGYEFDGETRTVDVHIRMLRQKLGKASEYIQTVRGFGYRLSE